VRPGGAIAFRFPRGGASTQHRRWQTFQEDTRANPVNVVDRRTPERYSLANAQAAGLAAGLYRTALGSRHLFGLRLAFGVVQTAMR